MRIMIALGKGTDWPRFVFNLFSKFSVINIILIILHYVQLYWCTMGIQGSTKVLLENVVDSAFQIIIISFWHVFRCLATKYTPPESWFRLIPVFFSSFFIVISILIWQCRLFQKSDCPDINVFRRWQSHNWKGKM